ncbi:MAG: hypothetical protein N2316_02950 [Spirochaetes bacterium]|nr:hypothetical protein [Spirochaetota bacterium]
MIAFLRWAIAFVCALQCIQCVHDPVDEEYYLDINRIKGKNKPQPPPVITTISQVGNEIIIDFSGTTTIDPDTGSAENLYYLFYAAFENPEFFYDERMYYDSLYYVGFVAHKDLVTYRVRIDVGNYTGDTYWWMTAYDGGRESDHSNVAYIRIQ